MIIVLSLSIVFLSINIDNIDESISNIEKLLNNPDDFNGWLMLGKSYSILKNYQKNIT